MKTILMASLLFFSHVSFTAPNMDEQMAQCKIDIERVRIQRNRQLLIEAGVNPQNIECLSHPMLCGNGWCVPDPKTKVHSWYIERAGGLCYDKTVANKPSLSDSTGSEGRTAPTTTAQKEAALKGCQTNLALLQAELRGSKMDREMAQCKSDIEQVRIKRNQQLLIDFGVNSKNIQCNSHPRSCMSAPSGQVCRPSVSPDVKSWYIEKATGVCYDRTASTKPSPTQGMGSEGRTPTSTAEKEAALKTCQEYLARLEAELAIPKMDREMAQCKITIEQVRIKRNQQLLVESGGVDSKNIQCNSHRGICLEVKNGKVCRPSISENVKSWYIEKAAGLCYDKTASTKPSSTQGMGSEGRTAPTSTAQKEVALKVCRTALALLQGEVAGSQTGRKMAQCKSDIEQVRIQRNRQLLIDSGVNPSNIQCNSHHRSCMSAPSGRVCRPSVSLDVKSWYIERAAGVCYDKTASTKPSLTQGMGSEGRTAPTSTTQKEAALKGCQTALALLKTEVAIPKMDREMAQCKINIEQVRIQRNRQALVASGVDLQNITCFSHPRVCLSSASKEVCRPTVSSDVKSWYIEKAAGICYDKTAAQKPSPTDSMGSAGRTPLATTAEKEASLKACQANLARLQQEVGGAASTQSGSH